MKTAFCVSELTQIVVTVYSSQTPVTTRKAPSDRDRGDIATLTAAVEISIKTINIPTPPAQPRRSVRLHRRRLRCRRRRIAQPDSGLVFHQTNDI